MEQQPRGYGRSFRDENPSTSSSSSGMKVSVKIENHFRKKFIKFSLLLKKFIVCL